MRLVVTEGVVPEKAAQLFHRIRQGPNFPRAYLATLEGSIPRIFTLTIVGFNFQKGHFLLATDSEPELGALLRTEPRGEALFYSRPERLELKSNGSLKAMGPGAIRDRIWKKFSKSETPAPWRFLLIQLDLFELECRDPGNWEHPIVYRRDQDRFFEATRTV